MSAYYRAKSDPRFVFHADHVVPSDHFTPVVVIDPEEREQVKRLAGMLHDYDAHLADDPHRESAWVSLARDALREFANPKPEEPTGLYARVRDSYGDVWFRSASGAWRMEQAPSRFADGGWCAVEAVEVLFAGVTEDAS